MKVMPNLIIAGCQKSGTTWAHFALNKHPDVFGSNPKELNFFNASMGRLEAGLDEYMSNFDAEGYKIYMESTPHYFQLPKNGIDVASNIEKLARDDLRVLVNFRNPVERAISAIIHHMTMGRIDYQEYIKELPSTNLVIELGMYADILKHWKSVLGDRLILRYYDDIRDQPKAYIDGLCDELGLTKCIEEADLEFRVNDKKQKATNEGIVVPKASPEVIQELVDIYRDQVDELFLLMGQECQGWHDVSNLESLVNS